MKPVQGGISPKQSCSCTSCLYRTESDRSSLRKIIAHGSKIDKLYYGKYIPLRERKLLDRLVRTRAVYDDIRNQLLSGSSVSVDLADLKPRKMSLTSKSIKDKQKNDIPALIDLVDKGDVFLPQNSSECCSCCDCDSNLMVHDEKSGNHKERRRAGAEMTSKSSVISRGRIGETKIGRAVHFKTKHIRSDPCTCSYKFNDMMKIKSKSVLKRLRKDRPEPTLEPLAGAPEHTKPRREKSIKKSVEKIQESKTRVIRGMQEGTRKSVTKIKETKTRLKKNVEAIAEKSSDKIRDTKQRLQEKKKINKHEPEYITFKREETTEEKVFKIRKDSLTKFREKLRKKLDLKDWECGFECHPEDCVPEQCFDIIKRRRLRKIKNNAQRGSTSTERHDEKNDDKPKVSEVNIQAQLNKKPKEISKQKQTTRNMKTAKTQKIGRSCLCVETKKKDVKYTKEKETLPSINATEIILKPSVLQKPLPRVIPTDITFKEKSKIPKQSLSGDKYENFRTQKRKEGDIKETEMYLRPRQAVRIGSSFSFHVEFYKDTPSIGASETKIRQEVRSIVKKKQKTSKSRDGHSFTSKVHNRGKASETTINKSAKNIQSFGHPLKRCFCTLKMKSHKEKVMLRADKATNKKCVCPCASPKLVKTKTESRTASMQTNKISKSSYVLEPYECEPICIPNACDPIDCEKRIRKRNKKRHSVSIYTKKQMKSTSSITPEFPSSPINKGFQVQSIRKPISGSEGEPAFTMSTAPVTKTSSSQRQAVRIGSTFSFQIEFSKGNDQAGSPVTHNRVLNTPTDLKSELTPDVKYKTQKSVPSAKRYIRHKYSQISSSTKAKFTTQKHKLRRCFCTLKFNKPEKNNKVKSITKATITSDQCMANVPELEPEVKTVSMSTKRVRKNKIIVESQLLPYECEIGVCNPGYCDPYKCLELIKRREIKELRSNANTANQLYRKTKSTSSFTPKQILRSRTKKVQSTLVTYKSNVPSTTTSEKNTPSKQLLESHKNHNKQAVRLGSSFSFNIEFYKDKSVNDVADNYNPPLNNTVKQERKTTPLRERGSQIAYVTERKSVFIEAVNKRKNVPVGTAMKRCICTLKLLKATKRMKKDFITVGTKTPKFKNNKPKFLELEPYECEPHVCTPGTCNPYKCLKSIKERNASVKSRNMGIIAKPSRMKSTSSSAQNVQFAIKDAYVQSNTVNKKITKKKLKQEKHALKSEQTPKMQKMNAKNEGKQLRQSVRLGSNINFDIEFYKDRKSNENKNILVPRERGDIRNSKLFKNHGEQPFTAVMHQHKSQVNVIKKVHRATGVTPILKRCFCTLQLHKKKNQSIKPPQVYTVSRVSVSKPTFVQKQRTPEEDKLYSTRTGTNRIASNKTSVITSFRDLYFSTVQFNSQLVFSSNIYHNSYAHSVTGPICSQPIIGLNSFHKNSNHVKQPRTVKSLCTKNPPATRHINKISEISLLKCYESYTSKIKQHPNEMSAYLRRPLCAMNIQVDKYNTHPIKRKHKPYECELGVCIPDECDTLICQERIIRRLMRKSLKSTGTKQRMHSASSATLNTRCRSKQFQSNGSIASPRKKQCPSTLPPQKIRYGSQQQAVRVGSNFSYNIEFSKTKTQPLNVVKDPIYYPITNRRDKKINKKVKHRGTTKYPGNRLDRESQYKAKMKHRGSSVTPFLKRCFCTLKLHKRDGGENGTLPTDNKETDSSSNNKVTVQTIDSTQNTEPFKYQKLRPYLRPNPEPYECEPGICIPGQCNPYNCLEIIKKRRLRGKEFGTHMMKLENISTASMTPTQKRKMKNRCNQLNCKEKRQRIQTYTHSAQSLTYDKTSRQAVRIGSSFSFHVDFFKENPNLQQIPSMSSKNVKYKPGTEVNIPSRTYDFKERFTQDNKSMLHKDSQSDSLQQKKSTMTNSFIKRCFCTAKLHRKEKPKSLDKDINVNIRQQSSGSPSFLQRCTCIMKSLTAAKFKKGTASQTKKVSASKPFNEVTSYRLEPYECTPGVCIPDECDPFVCEQQIRNRNAKVCTKETCTGRRRTRSQSSNIESYRTPGTKQTQMTVDTNSRVVKPTSSGDFNKRRIIDSSVSPGRQAVRIGSNFNFNIEFYKDRPKTERIKDKSLMSPHKKRRRTSDGSKRYRPKTRDRGSFERRIQKHSRDSQVQSNTRDRASGVGLFLQRCFCTLNLHKPKVPKTYSESGTQSRRTIVRNLPNIDTKSVMTVNKINPHKLESYECEPNTCIPGQCDPNDCDKRIKKRLRREYGTSTVQHRTKSATSMASSPQQLNNIKTQSRSKKTRRNRTGMERPRKFKYKETHPRNRPTRQAVRIGSSFSFNIDFLKEHINDTNVKLIPESKIRNKDIADLNRSHERRSKVPCNTKTCQAKARMREVDSQVLAKKMRSTMSGVTPFLKRCFCTLKLQKPIDRVQHEKENNKSPPRRASENKSTYTSGKFNNTRTRVRGQHIDPYECEPGVCVPGECDPYKCEEHIKKRDIMRHSVASNAERRRDFSKYASANTRYKGNKSHATSATYKRPKHKVPMSDKHRPSVRRSGLNPFYSPNRQAVRIGSNFSFDIEFYKDKSAKDALKETDSQMSPYKSKQVNGFIESSKSRIRNMGTGNKGISFNHRKSQVYEPKTDTKGSGVGPFLKKCFCTLKLHKQGKQQNDPSVRLQTEYMHQSGSFDASTETKKQRRVLEPYECEPNVCIPGFCDPYECLRRIKHRQTKESGVTTESPTMRSDYSLTSRTTKDQSIKTKHFKDKRLQRNVSFDKEPRHKTKRHSLAYENTNRQAVRIGSSFNFDIEFYKQGSTPNDQGHGDGKTYDTSPSREYKQKARKSRSRGSQDKCSPYCQGVQMESIGKKSRGSGMAPLLKKCFCTLALQNTSKQLVQTEKKPILEAKTKDTCTQSKCAFNKSKSLPYALEPYECEPNVCVPGVCDPYDCYERIKRRNTRHKSKGLGTDAKRYSHTSNMTTGDRKFSQSKRTQSVLLTKHKLHHRSSSANESMVVEQPRLQLLSDIANRNVVRIGSNISFNIEFYKEVAPTTAKIHHTKAHPNSEVPIERKHKNTFKTSHYRSRDSQAQTPKFQNKSSLVSNALKRCFCTAQLHKANASPPKRDAVRKCVECRPKPIFGPQQYQVYYHKTSLKKKPTERCMCTTCDNKKCQNNRSTSTKSKRRIRLRRRSATKSKKIQNANEMETILPYAPNKFNKKASKTLFVKSNKGIVGEKNEYCKKLQCPKFKNGIKPKNRKLKKTKSTKKLNVNKVMKSELKNKDAITSTTSNINNKSFLCRCKELFTKKKNINNNVTDTCVETCPLCKSDKRKKGPTSKQSEILKKTKSERHPIKFSKKEPKTSKSLKIKNPNDLEQTRQDYSEFQSGDMLTKKAKHVTSKSRKSKILPDGYKTNHLHCGDDYLYLYVTDLFQKLIKDNKKQVKFSGPLNDGLTASSNLTPKSIRKDKIPRQKVTKKGPSKLEPIKANCQTDSASYLDIVLQPSYCSGTKMEGIGTVTFKGDKKPKTNSGTNRKLTTNERPLQEHNTYDPGLSKQKPETKGDQKRSMKPGASLKIAPRGSKKQSVPGGKCDIEQIIETLTKNINAIKNAKSRVLDTLITKEQICSCYSSVCECAKAIRKEKVRAQKIEMELEHEKHMLEEKEKRHKEAIKEAKRKHKDFLLRQKRYTREDATRRRKRLKENKLLSHRLKHVKTSDVLLAADSVLDIAKLGCTVVGDVARSTGRFLIDPAYTCKKMKNVARDPGSMIKNAINDSGLVATLKRVFMRLTAMRGIRTMKSSLEDNQFTGYLMKMAEDDPRKRMKLKKKKQAKKKEPALDDFECSLYMASLRKKRFIAVYYLCPWFYPHFITMINVVEQVTDLILFLLAVFVWSPCILCMELCRAFVCCFFCTG